ncbi:hypothetical protein MSROBK_023140 [Spiroplasma poulsonii]|nr:hypothetical protein MSROBK_023140 [Spiroplasma poulsonii]
MQKTKVVIMLLLTKIQKKINTLNENTNINWKWKNYLKYSLDILNNVKSEKTVMRYIYNRLLAIPFLLKYYYKI